MKNVALGALATACVFAISSPTYAKLIDLSAYADNNISTYTDGSAYPGPGVANVAGINFELAGFDGGTGIVRDVSSSALNNISVDISIGETGISDLFAIVNSADGGSAGSNVGNLVLTAANGATETINLIEGVNIRDHYSGVFNNTTANLYGTQNYTGGAHFDVYDYSLPASFNNTLASVKFTSYELGFPLGSPFVAGLTTEDATSISAVPEPATWMMMILGFGLVGGVLRSAYRKSEEEFTRKVRSLAI